MRRSPEDTTIANGLPVSLKTLRGLPLFSGIDEADLRDLMRRGRLIRARAGETLWPTGRRQGLVMLLSGWAKLQATSTDGERAVLRILKPGDLAGGAVRVPERGASLDLLAIDDCQAVAWGAEVWKRAQRRCPRIAWNLVDAQTEYIRDLQQRCAELAGVRVEVRLARAVLRLARVAGRSTARGIEIRMPLTREDLAELVGTWLHTVSRTLREWERKGWVIAEWKRLVVVDTAALRGIVEGIDDV